ALGAMGPAARDAAPTLLHLLMNYPDDYRYSEISAYLCKIGGPEALPALRRLLVNSHHGGRAKISYPNLHRHLAKLVIPEMTTLLTDEDARIRYGVLDGFQALGPAARPVLPQLRARLHDPERYVHVKAAETVGALDPSAVWECMWVLNRALVNHYYSSAQMAEALRRFGPERAMPHLLPILTHSLANVRNQAPAARAQAGAPAVSVLLQAAAAPEAGLRRGAALALGRFPANPAAANHAAIVKALIKAVGDRDTEVRLTAAESLTTLDPKQAPMALPALVRMLDDADASIRSRSTVLIGRIGPAAKDAFQNVLARLGDFDTTVRLDAAATLRLIAPADAAVTVPTLIAVANDKRNMDNRFRAISLLTALGPQGKDATNALLEILKERAPALQIQAGEALVAVNHEQAKVVVDVLKDLLPGEPYYQKLRIIRVFGRAGADAKDTVPALVAELKSAKNRGTIGLEVASTLGQIGAAAKDALPALMEAFKAND